MPSGPHLIFDKSTLAALTPDEAVWLDQFFRANITPLFFMETLADLEKEVAKGRRPELVVGNLAEKTPDLESTASMHHSRILNAELFGQDTIPMDGRIPREGGKVVELDGNKGILYGKSPEDEALERWYKRDFLDIERQFAKLWRREISNLDLGGIYRYFAAWFLIGKPKTFAEAKSLAQACIDGFPPEDSLKFGLSLFGIPAIGQQHVLQRWAKANRPPIKIFAPYFHFLYSIELFFDLCIAADLISRERPSNKLDIAYLYYLPFCHVFTSGDKLHARTVPLFLRDDQSFVSAQDLKAGLRQLDQLYSALPEETRNSGLHRFASYPPLDDSYLVTRLWDKHLRPVWRASAARPPLDPRASEALLELVEKIERESKQTTPDQTISIGEASFMQISRPARRSKGKWQRFGPEVK
jgi:hypothetical protein